MGNHLSEYVFLIDSFAILIISATYLSMILKVTEADILQQIIETIKAVTAAVIIIFISVLHLLPAQAV